MTREWMTKEWNPDDDGWWIAGCVLCDRPDSRSPMLPTSKDCGLWATEHFKTKHPDRISEAERMHSAHFFPGPRTTRIWTTHASGCPLWRGEACTCGGPEG